MSSRQAYFLAFGVSTLLVACLAALVISLLPLLLVRHDQARQRWKQHNLRHYEVEVAWSSNWSHGHLRAEMRDNRIVGGVDLDTGRSLVPLSLESAPYGANYYVVIDNLFELIQAQSRTPANWRTLVARYNPLLAGWLAPCAAPLPTVRYDAEYGYPTSINYRGSPCTKQGDVNVMVKHFQPLP